MNIPLDADVHCTDGPGGHTTAIVVEPQAQQATHIVVQHHGSNYLIPFAAIAESGAGGVQLRWSLAELAGAAPFEEVAYVGDEAAGGVPVPSAVVPFALDPEYAVEAVELSYLRVEQVPEGQVAIHREASAEATDGRAGEIDGFTVDQATGQITHVLFHHGHLWAKHHVAVPASTIAHIRTDVVMLSLDRSAVSQLPDISS